MTTQTLDQPSNHWLTAALIILALLLALFGTACDAINPQQLAQLPETAPPPGDAGPQSWIEFPIEGRNLPLESLTESLTLVVYAGDPKGIAQVDVSVNGQPLSPGQTLALGPNGSVTLVRVEPLWQPTAEGQYIIEARSRNTAGTYGEPTTVKVCVGACGSPTPTPAASFTPTPAPAASFTPTPAPAASFTPTPAPANTATPTPTPAIAFTPTRTSTSIPAPATLYDLYVRRMDFSVATPLVGQTIQLYVMIATDTYPSQGPFFPASSFRWRQGPTFPWREETCPANAQYAQCSKTVTLAPYTAPGVYRVEVVADSQGQIAETNEGNNTKFWDLTVGAAPTATPTPTTPPPPPAQVSISFYADPQPYVNAGSCVTLRWDVEGVKAVYLDGQGVTGHGSKKVCPCETTTYTLHVVKQDNSTEDRQVTVIVSGSCQAPPPPPPPPPADNTGPTITNVRVEREGCQFFGRANLSDPSGISDTKFWYNLNGQGWIELHMHNIGGDLWETDSGIYMGGSSGSIEFSVWASDTRNNGASSDRFSETFSGCGY